MSPYRLIVLNGGSSSGKTTLGRALQRALPRPWALFGVDTLIDALPPTDLDIAEDGSVTPGPDFAVLDRAWGAGLVAMAAAGGRVIVDEVLLSGGEGQRRWKGLIGDVPALWVGVRCAPDIAEAREKAREDRPGGMARLQAEKVHNGVRYDLEVDTGEMSTGECVARIVRGLAGV